MPADVPTNTHPSKRRGWMRRVGRWIAWTALALLIFHRPLIHFAGRHVAIWFAKREHMTLELRLAGNLWSTLEVRDVALRADGSGRAPLERLNVDRMAVDYDLWKVIRADWRRALRRVEVGKVDGVAKLQEPDPDKPSTSIAEVLEEILSNSLSPVEQLTVGRVDFEVQDIVSIRGLHAEVSDQKPGFIAWEKIHIIGFPDIAPARAELVTSESSITIGKLSLLPELVIKRLSLNRVTETLPRGGLEIAVEAGGGAAALRVEPSLTAGALDVSIDAKGVRVNEIAADFSLELPTPMIVESFQAKFKGAPEHIEKSVAAVGFVIRSEEKAPFPAVTFRGQAKWEQDVFRVSELVASGPGVDFTLGGEVNFPLKTFHPSRLAGEIAWTVAASAADLPKIAGAPPIQGTVAGMGKLRLERREAILTGDLEATKLSQGAVQIESAKIHLDARRKIESFSDILRTVGAGLSLDARGITAEGIHVDGVSMKGTMDEQKVSIEQFSVTAGENQFSGTGRVVLKPDATGLASAPEMELLLAAPRLEQFGVMLNGVALSGAASAEGKVRLDGDQLAGSVQFSGKDLLLGKAPLGGFSGLVRFENGVAILESADIDVAEAGKAVIKGRVGLAAPMSYSGELNLNLTNLAKLDALFDAVGHPTKLGGTLTLDWTGDGQIEGASQNGKLQVSGRSLRHEALVINEARIVAAYSPVQFETNELLIIADKARVGGRIGWKEGRLSLSDLAVALAGEEVLRGEASAPFDPKNPQVALSPDQPLTAQFAAKRMDIQRLLSNFGLSAPVSGTVSGDLVIGGTVSKPDARLTVQARDMRSPKAASLAPAEVDVNLRISDSRLTVAAVARQRDIQPLTLNASVPFEVEKLLAQPALLRELPIEAALRLPASSLGLVPRLVPSVARINGTVSANITVRGTVGKPVLNGETVIATTSVRLASESIPPISNFSARLNFAGDTVTLRDTRGEIGGGSFRVEGNVKLPTLDRPEFDLRLRSDKVLVLREEAITVRADTDVTLRGPLAAATVAGTVFVTQSRFFKDVDILPLSIRGRATPQARSVPAPRRISFPNPPLRDWKFDLAIRTRERDPFLIRGNLARGAAAVNLRLGGTGLNPFLTGQVQIENFTAILPTSRLEVKRGSLMFFEDAPFEPRLDIQAESRIGRTTVTVGVTGTAAAPRIDLDSEPPLAERDILSLLATGTTTGELGSNATALATRAALLKGRQWFRRTFNRGMEDDLAEDKDSFLDRFEMDIANVDAKTGRPEVTGSIRLTDNLYFLGEIDTQGQAVMSIKYLLRFR